MLLLDYHQVECHPMCPQTSLREYCGREGIAVVSYASLGQLKGADALRGSPVVTAIAERLGKTPAQVLMFSLFNIRYRIYGFTLVRLRLSCCKCCGVFYNTGVAALVGSTGLCRYSQN